MYIFQSVRYVVLELTLLYIYGTDTNVSVVLSMYISSGCIADVGLGAVYSVGTICRSITLKRLSWHNSECHVLLVCQNNIV